MTSVRREPLQPNDQTDVTLELTGVQLDLEACSICTQNRGVSQHHIVFRSHGGHDGPTMPLCLDCHNRIHDRIWDIQLQDDGMEVVERTTGEVVWRLKEWPLPGTAGDFVALLENVIEATKLMPLIAPALLPYQALEVFRALRDLGEGGWKAQSRLIGEMFQYRFPGRSGPERVEALRDAFGLRRSQVYNLLAVYREFGSSPVLDASPLSMRYFIEASRAEEPVAWLKLAEERKLAVPQFGAEDLRQEIKKAGARKWEPAEEKSQLPLAPQMVWAKCPHCGESGWMEKLPVGSDGQPINLEDYRV